MDTLELWEAGLPPHLGFCLASQRPSRFREEVFSFRPKWEYGKTERGNEVGVCTCPSVDLISQFRINSTDGDITYIFQKYLEDMKTYFGAEPQSVNFVGASGQIRKEINSWVESQTEGKLSPGCLTEHFLQALLYFFF